MTSTDTSGTDPDEPRTLMWEAKAAVGRGADLLAWLVAAAPRGQVFRSGDRVVLVLDLDAGPPPGDPPGELLARPVHGWKFSRIR